jgi:uncharacterized protein
MELIVRESGERLAGQVREANTFWARFKGLMFTPSLPAGSSLHIRPCKSVHTFFMKYPIDVLYLDADRTIVGIDAELGPGKLGGSYQDAVSVVELPAGQASRMRIRTGQALEFV